MVASLKLQMVAVCRAGCQCRSKGVAVVGRSRRVVLLVLVVAVHTSIDKHYVQCTYSYIHTHRSHGIKNKIINAVGAPLTQAPYDHYRLYSLYSHMHL